jgi:S-formylglutathione hydrolase FrmB
MPPHKEGVTERTRELAEKNIKEGKLLPKFFMTWGDKDFVREGHTESTNYLKELGYDVYSEEVPGYGHEWDFWDLTLRKALNEWLPIRHSVIYPGEE